MSSNAFPALDHEWGERESRLEEIRAMTNKPDAPSAPLGEPSFAERFAEVEALIAADEGRQAYPGNGPTMRALIACIREQQAALQHIVSLTDGYPLLQTELDIPLARATLAKWSLP